MERVFVNQATLNGLMCELVIVNSRENSHVFRSRYCH